LVPHFEKMLYDNALLVSTLSDAYKLTHHHRFEEVIEETIGFIQRELMHSKKGFFSALDADSEGEEGKFYIWSKSQIEELLGDDAITFCNFFSVTENGNWENKNILWQKQAIEIFSIENNIQQEELLNIIQKGKKILLNERATRIRPLLDDKIILGWNALMNSACTRAYRATGKVVYKQLAVDNMNFLLENLVGPGKGEFFHTWKNDIAKFPAYLDDYAFLIEALLNLQEITGDTRWLKKAEEITLFVMDNFYDTESDFFFYTKLGQPDVIVRKKEVYDASVPSGNSVMANNLLQLSILLGNDDWKQKSIRMITVLEKAIINHPASFANWLHIYLNLYFGMNEVAITGFDIDQLKKEIFSKFVPNLVLMSATREGSEYPLLKGKMVTGQGNIFLCRNYTCKAPVFSTESLISLINKGKNL